MNRPLWLTADMLELREHQVLHRLSAASNVVKSSIPKMMAEWRAWHKWDRRFIQDRANEGRRDSQHRIWWERLLKPLYVERTSVNAGITHYERLITASRHSERAEVWVKLLTLYKATLDLLWADLTHLRDTDPDKRTPGKIAEQDRVDVRNGGWHWTDWVPDKLFMRILLKFDAAPSPPRGRTRKALERTMPPRVWVKEHERLMSNLRDEESRLYGLIDKTKGAHIEGNANHAHARAINDAALDRVHLAREKLNDWPYARALPPTWPQLLNPVDTPDQKTITQTRPGALPDADPG